MVVERGSNHLYIIIVIDNVCDEGRSPDWACFECSLERSRNSSFFFCVYGFFYFILSFCYFSFSLTVIMFTHPKKSLAHTQTTTTFVGVLLSAVLSANDTRKRALLFFCFIFDACIATLGLIWCKYIVWLWYITFYLSLSLFSNVSQKFFFSGLLFPVVIFPWIFSLHAHDVPKDSIV